MSVPGAVDPWHTTMAVLAQQPSPAPDGGGQGADFGKSSPLGFLILILFLIAVAFLVRSMTKHIKRIPASFDSDDVSDSDDAETPEAETGEPASAGDSTGANGDNDSDATPQADKPQPG